MNLTDQIFPEGRPSLEQLTAESASLAQAYGDFAADTERVRAALPHRAALAVGALRSRLAQSRARFEGLANHVGEVFAHALDTLDEKRLTTCSTRSARPDMPALLPIPAVQSIGRSR